MDYYDAMQAKLKAEAEREKITESIASGGISGIPGAPTPGNFLVDHGLDRLGDTEAPREVKRYDLEHLFSYHRPGVMEPFHYDAIRSSARHFAEVVLKSTPRGSDQDAAIRKIREAVMTANAAIATRGYGTP